MNHMRTNTEVIVPTKEEAEWLRDLLQNPVYEDETREEKRMRGVWYPALVTYIKSLEQPTYAACSNCYRNKPQYDEDDIPF